MGKSLVMNMNFLARNGGLSLLLRMKITQGCSLWTYKQ